MDARGCKYLAAEERRRFLAAVRLAPRPEDQTFALTLAHIGTRVCEALAIRPFDVDLEATLIRVQTLKRHAERWRKVLVPPESSVENSTGRSTSTASPAPAVHPGDPSRSLCPRSFSDPSPFTYV